MYIFNFYTYPLLSFGISKYYTFVFFNTRLRFLEVEVVFLVRLSFRSRFQNTIKRFWVYTPVCVQSSMVTLSYVGIRVTILRYDLSNKSEVLIAYASYS